MVQNKHQNRGGICDLSDFDCGMVVSARQGALSKKLLISWDFHAQQFLDFTENDTKNTTSSDWRFCVKRPC